MLVAAGKYKDGVLTIQYSEGGVVKTKEISRLKKPAVVKSHTPAIATDKNMNVSEEIAVNNTDFENIYTPDFIKRRTERMNRLQDVELPEFMVERSKLKENKDSGVKGLLQLARSIADNIHFVRM